MTGAAEGAPAQTAGSAAPFPGLRPFSFEDHAYFFGREDQTFALCALLLRHHFVAVIGSSGSGKSSIVRAGLLPELDKENQRSSGDPWHWVTMRPGRDPIGHLAEALAGSEHEPLFDARRSRIEATLKSSSRGISDAIEHTTIGTNAQLVLVVDQFEELFRYLSAGPKQLDRTEAEQRRDETTEFVQLLLTATQSRGSNIRVVITMRSDFIGECALFQGLPEAVSAAQFLVPSLSKDQRREAIREPIKLAGGTIDPELVEKLVEDSGTEADQLPVLQHCLARLWTRAAPPAAGDATPDSQPESIRRLTVKDYNTIGGLAGALSGHAEEILEGLPDQEKTIEQIFRALGEVDKDGRAIRRARPLAQLIDETSIDQKVNRESVQAVLKRFRADDCSFVVPAVSTALTDETVIDVGHEALLRGWKRVCGDPEATGERADKRDIGWLRQEKKDGEAYQFLRSCVDPDSPNDSRLPANQVERYSSWWKSRKPNRAWAERYGGKFDDVERLVLDSEKASSRTKLAKVAAFAAAAIVAAVVSGVIFASWQRQRLAEQAFFLVLTSASKQSDNILAAFNEGQMSAAAATKFTDVVDGLLKAAARFNQTSESFAAGTKWLLTTSDIQTALGDTAASRSNAAEAAANARKYMALEPDKRRWQELLYGSLFRLGDLDLDRYIEEHDPKASDLAFAEYEESERIADKLLSSETPTTGNFATADVDKSAKQRFELAFAINKVGEAREVKEDYEGAIAKYRQALQLAMLIEGATRMEWQLQSATTRIKIAGALMKQTPSDLDGSVRNYSEAIEREEAVFKNNPDNNIVRSNLGTAHQGRAEVLLKNKMFDAAFKDYAESIKLFAQLNEDDPRNTDWLARLAQVRSKYGKALEDYATSRNEPLDKAIEQCKAEVATRARLAERGPANVTWQKGLQNSQEKLRKITATPPQASPVAQE